MSCKISCRNFTYHVNERGLTMSDKIIYKLDDKISFRKCSLADEDMVVHGDCTNYSIRKANWTTYYLSLIHI